MPARDEYDLQTVLIDEFGHLAGNERHGPVCRPAPMMAALSPGDWWHSTRDHRVSCRRSAQASAASAAKLRFVHRRIVSREYETQVVGDAGARAGL